MNNKSEAMIMVGYHPTRGYRLFYPITKKTSVFKKDKVIVIVLGRLYECQVNCTEDGGLVACWLDALTSLRLGAYKLI
ncbi:hypothetical protein CR513_58387, partial [Mucuna pruriens]